jgi:recombination protein RecA
MSTNLQEAMKKINKIYGAGSIMTLGDTEPVTTNLLSTGSLMIDKILGGGIARGRITEIFGPEGSGKTTLCTHIVAQCQKEGGKVAYVDVEQSYDIKYAEKLGVNSKELVFSQPSSAEQALDIVDMLARTGEISLIVVDSVAALAPQAELDGEIGDANIGLSARLMSKCMRKIASALNETNCAVIFINQLRAMISTGWSAGPSETTPGGRALKYAASQRIDIRKSKAIKSGEEVIGAETKIKIVKNKIAPPMKSCVVPLIFGEGFRSEDEAINLGIEYGLIEKTGGWYTTHDGVRLQGLSTVTAYYKDKPEVFEDLREKVKSKLSGIEIESTYEVDEETGEIIE